MWGDNASRSIRTILRIRVSLTTPQSEGALADLRDENRRLHALLDFSREVTAERDLRAQLRLLCAEVRRATGCPAAAVILRDPEQGGVESIETCGLPPAVHAEWLQAARATSLDVVPAGFQLAANVPLAVGDDQIGLVLAFERLGRTVSDRSRSYLARVADAAAMAMLNARLYAQSHRELRRRDALRRVVASISSELDLDSLFGRVIAGAVELLDTDDGVISLVSDAGAARIRAVHNLPADFVGRVIAPGEGITGQVLVSRGPVTVGDYAHDLPRPL